MAGDDIIEMKRKGRLTGPSFLFREMHEEAEGFRRSGWVGFWASWFETRGYAALLTMRG